jgi:DNA invertase Pin-like site-specific DNA recombinase
METAAKVYCYIRFSSPAQATGTSVARQTELAARYAADHGLTLDTALSMRDEGLSTFHGKHVKTGALGIFLRAIEDGKVPPGSVLVVKGLDRLSRTELILAQGQLSSHQRHAWRVIRSWPNTSTYDTLPQM